MTQLAHIAGRAVDLSHPDVVFLASYIVELEGELGHAREYLEQCRRLVGAGEDEMLLDAIGRRLPRYGQPHPLDGDHRAKDRDTRVADRDPTRRRTEQV